MCLNTRKFKFSLLNCSTMNTFLRRVSTWRPLHQQVCQFCFVGPHQVSTENASPHLPQTNNSTEGRKSAKHLALRLRATHLKLKSGLMQGKDFKEVWAEHSSDATDLSEYASTMCSIAQHWEGLDTSLKGRNTWIEAEVRRYYYRRHNLAALQEELHRAKLDPALLTPRQEQNIGSLQTTLNALWKRQVHEDLLDPHAGFESPDKVPKSARPERMADAAAPANVLPDNSCSLPKPIVCCEESGDTWQLCPTSRVRVLDVGSCYNPLARFPHLHVTPLDLMPATQDVFKCDFVNVKVAEASECIDALEVEEDTRSSRQIERLPRSHYDVVVFSLVLDYIPCPEARLQCCATAYRLLRPGGLLLIVTPSCSSGTYSKLLLKWNQLHLARLGYGLLNKVHSDSYRTFAYRKAFFQSFWSTTEAKKIDAEAKGMRGLLKILKTNEEKIDGINLEKGLYFSRDVGPLIA